MLLKLILIGFFLSHSGFSRTLWKSSEFQNSWKIHGQEVLLSLTLPTLQSQKKKNLGIQGEVLMAQNIALTSDPGYTAVPFTSKILIGRPQDIQILKIYTINKTVIPNYEAFPSQDEPCRCLDLTRAPVAQKLRPENRSQISIDFLGFYRGVPLTRVKVLAAHYQEGTKELTLYPQLGVHLKTKYVQKEIDTLVSDSGKKQILLVATAPFAEALESYLLSKDDDFIVNTEIVSEETAKNPEELQKILHERWKREKFEFSLLVGDQQVIRPFFVATSTDDQTPSDLPFFLMDGRNDKIPDVFYGRILVSRPEQIAGQIQKWIDYEALSPRMWKGIGIASNEGYGPSDDEYIKHIQNTFEKNTSAEFFHFYENDPLSNPVEINHALDTGIHWLTYMGHGDGHSWPSTHETYFQKNISQLLNASSEKPVIIDVACQNGKLLPEHFGERWMNQLSPEGGLLGASAYYGGSVNISWHPPAIMAKGMAIKIFEKKLRTLGEILLAGQLYLIENYSNLEAATENLKWYHLFGDPSMKIPLQ